MVRPRTGVMVLLAASLLAGGCASTSRQVQRTRSIMVTSETPGARVLLDEKDVGQTPLQVKIRYVEGEEWVTPEPPISQPARGVTPQ